MPSLKGTLKTTGVIWSPNANIRVTILRTSQALLQDVTSLLLLLPSIDCCCYCCPSIAAAACSTPPLLISILASLFFQRRYGAHAWMLPWNRSSRSSRSFSGLNYVRLTIGFDSKFFFSKTLGHYLRCWQIFRIFDSYPPPIHIISLQLSLSNLINFWPFKGVFHLYLSKLAFSNQF